MPRRPKRLPVLALIALVFLLPALATAAPHYSEAVLAPAERHDASPSLLTQLQGLLSFLWKNGSGLDPDGRPGPGPATTTGDTGSGLDPNGRP